MSAKEDPGINVFSLPLTYIFVQLNKNSTATYQENAYNVFTINRLQNLRNSRLKDENEYTS